MFYRHVINILFLISNKSLRQILSAKLPPTNRAYTQKRHRHAPVEINLTFTVLARRGSEKHRTRYT